MNKPLNHNYNKILESDWFLARPIFYQIGARAAKVSNNKGSNNKVRVLRMRAIFIWFLVKYSLIFLKPSASRMAFCLSDKSLVGYTLSKFFLECCYTVL